MRRVVITGMSALCSLGSSHEKVFEALYEKKQILKKLDDDYRQEYNIKTKYVVPLPEYDSDLFKKEISHVKKRGAARAVRAVYTVLGAIKDSGIQKLDNDTMIVVGEGIPNICEFEDILKDFKIKHRVNPMCIPLIMPNSTAAWISISLGTHGRSMQMCTACASGTDAVGMSYQSILNGSCNMAICGGNDYLVDSESITLPSFEQLRAVTNADDGRSLPFSEEHKGFLFSEGAAGFLVLEELDHALARNAKIYAEITGYEYSCDAYNIVAMPESAEHITIMMKKLLNGKKVDYYNAHGTGTILNDNTEAKMICEVFGDKENQPAINSTKAFIGHTIGASGAIEAIVCADSIYNSKIHGNICGTIMNNLNVSAESREIDIERAVSASFGFGGHNSALMFEKFKL